MTGLCHDLAVQMSNTSVLITAAAGMAVFSAAVAVLSRRGRVPVAWLAVGVPGVYLGLTATVEDLPWLFCPTGVLLLASAAIQVWPAIRSGRHDARHGPGE